MNEQLRAVGGLIACGEPRAYALLLNTRLLEGTLLHRAVECAFIKKNATEWLGLFNADETEWKRLLESKQPILFDAIESRYVQQRIMGILSQGGCQLPETLLMRYFAVSDKDSEAYEQALLLVERHDGSADFKTFKKYLNERLQCARDLQIVACVKGLSSRLESVRLQSVVMLVNLGDSSTVEPLIGTLADEHELVRVFAVKALARIGDPRAVQPLIGLLCDSEERVRREAAAALEQLGEVALLGLIAALNTLNLKLFKKVVDLLISLHKERALNPLIDLMLSHAGPEFRAVAIRSMGNFSCVKVVEALRQSAVEDPSSINRASAAKFLRIVQECSE